jgi:hypothetical protein
MTLTRDELSRMERLDPGVYVDRTGAMHLVADELLEAHGFAATEGNIALLEEELRAVASAYGISEVECLTDA